MRSCMNLSGLTAECYVLLYTHSSAPFPQIQM
jgi:hypothetical protein